jgi:hypothetical protein
MDFTIEKSYVPTVECAALNAWLLKTRPSLRPSEVIVPGLYWHNDTISWLLRSNEGNPILDIVIVKTESAEVGFSFAQRQLYAVRVDKTLYDFRHKYVATFIGSDWDLRDPTARCRTLEDYAHAPLKSRELSAEDTSQVAALVAKIIA